MKLSKLFSGYNKVFEPRDDISEITKLKLEVALRVASYKVSDHLKDLCFDLGKLDSEGYISYMEGFKIKNLTNKYLEGEGVTIFKVKASENVELDLHDHKNQSQTIMVQKGKLTILDSNIEIFENESFFIKKNKEHKIMYMKDTEAIIIYLPNLEKLD